MRVFLALFLVLFAITVSQCQYSTKFDTFDIDSVLNSQRVLKNYVKCLLEKGPCTPEGKDFRKILPEVLETTCAKCSPGQKRVMRKIVNHLRSKNPADWEKITAKYDKDKKYTQNIEVFAAQKE